MRPTSKHCWRKKAVASLYCFRLEAQKKKLEKAVVRVNFSLSSLLHSQQLLTTTAHCAAGTLPHSTKTLPLGCSQY